jgi:hypothetical protein
MTRAWRAGVLIAFFAALLGAPSAVLAVPPNRLSAATVSPTSGSPNTILTFAVRYSSATGTASGTVTVTVAGRTLAMSRVSGTSSDGVYVVSATLPAGTWPTTFNAYPAGGHQPQLAGPQIRITAFSTPQPTTSATTAAGKVGDAPASPESMPISNEAAPTSAAQPVPTAGAVAVPTDTTTQAVRASTVSAPDGAVAPSDGPLKPAAATSSAAAAPANDPPGGAGAEPPNTAASPSSASEASVAPGSIGPSIDDDSPWPALALGIFGMAALAITGIAWLLLGRRRREQDDGMVTVGAMRRDGPTAVTTDQLLGRAARRSRLDPSDDPIVAAMGLKPRRGSTPRFQAGQVNRGPGERPVNEPRKRRRS